MVGEAPGWDGLRALRLATFTVLATCLALGSHLLAGGTAPGFGATLLGAALPAAAAVALTRRRRGLLSILAVLGAVQLAMHQLFAAAAAPPAGHASHPMIMAGHGHLTAEMDAAHGHAQHADPVMVAWHAVAVVLTAALLARGEQVLHALVELLRRLARGGLPGPARITAVRPRLPRPVTASPAVRRRGLVLAAALGRRGPPVPIGC